jgi:hypothetical protein
LSAFAKASAGMFEYTPIMTEITEIGHLRKKFSVKPSFLIPARVIIVWIYNNTGKSLFATILYHAMSNVSMFLFPNYGSHYDPFITSIILVSIAAIVVFAWGPKTLARFT